jgi:hypothetical protein
MRAVRILMVSALAGALVAIAPPAQAAPVTLTASMTADEEVPEKGPAGATGSATLDVNQDANEVCYTFVTQNMSEPVTAGHIHKGAKGVAGDIVVDLKMAAGNLKGCATGEAAKIQAVLADPQGHYVNLHTGAHPKGALRGQLMTAVTNPQAGAAQQQAQPAVPPQLSQASPQAAAQLPRTGPGSAGLLLAVALGLLSAGTAARVVARRG